jgi:hypothetical protein
MIYLLISFFLLLFAIHYDVNSRKIDNSLVILWWLIFVLLAGLRYRVGGDTTFYMQQYTSVPVISKLSYETISSNVYQPFWVILSSLSKSVSKDFTFFQFIHAIITTSIVFYFIRKNTDYFFTGILFYFIFYYLYFNTEILRETLAICIFLISLKYFYSNRWLVYYSLCLLAFMFHLSAIMLFVLPVFKLGWTYRSYILFLLIVLLIFVFFKDDILRNISNFIPHEGIRTQANKYLGAKVNLNGIIYTSVVNILTPLFLLFISEKIVGYKSKFRSFLYLYILISLLSIFLGPFYRFINYLVPLYYLFLANMIHALFRYPPVRKFKFTISLLIFLLPFSLHLLTIGEDTSEKVPGTRLYSRWYPYYSVLNKKVDTKREELIKMYMKDNYMNYVYK